MHLDAGFPLDVPGKEFIGDHDDFRYAKAFHDTACIAGRAADVCLGLYGSGTVHIGNDRHAGVAFPQGADIFRRDTFGQGAACQFVRDEDGLRGVQQLDRFGHEMDARHDDDILFQILGLTGQSQTVPPDVGHAMEDFRCLIVMGKDDSVMFALQFKNGLDVICKKPFPVLPGHKGGHGAV